MTWKLSSLFAMLCSLFCFFQEVWPVAVSPNEPLIPVVRGNQWGFINSKGQVALPFQWHGISYPWYDRIVFDSANMAVMDESGHYGWINRKGTYVIPPKWNYVRSFDSSNMAAVSEKSLWGWIDRSGSMVIEPKWIV